MILNGGNSCLISGPSVYWYNSRLNTLGYRIGTRVLELMTWRTESTSKAPKREIRFLPALMSIHTQVWRAVFGKPADAIEKSVENEDECERRFLPLLVVDFPNNLQIWSSTTILRLLETYLFLVTWVSWVVLHSQQESWRRFWMDWDLWVIPLLLTEGL